ncbi:MAG: peptidoglycan recognition protein family protein [Chloroflexota bacterium]|nr:peptidoglycan recognition protein family protein [Chloroflexota bacterium]
MQIVTNVAPRRKLGRRRVLRAWAAVVATGAGLASLGASDAAPLQDDPAPSMPPIIKPDAPWFVPSSRDGAPREAAPTAAELPPFVRPRAAWTAAPPARPYVPQVPTGISFHHTGAPWTGTPGPEQYLRNIQAFHTGPERAWEDIAYHFLIDLDGNVWEGRPATVRGNRSAYYDPTGLVLISYLGEYGSQELTEPQIAAGVETAAWIVRHYGISFDAPLTGHRDHAPTSCPGSNVYKLLQDGTFPRRLQAVLDA